MPHDHSGHSHPEPPVLERPALVSEKPNLTVTARASAQIKEIMAAEGAADAALRLGVEPGGCAGYQYALSFAKAPDGDEVATESNGIRVLVSRANLGMLNGVLIDFVETAMGSGFNIKNPNAKSTCGCGNTFDA